MTDRMTKESAVRRMNEQIQAAKEAGTLVVPEDAPRPIFKRSSLRDPAFYAANAEAIDLAAREGRVIDDVTAARQASWGGRN